MFRLLTITTLLLSSYSFAATYPLDPMSATEQQAAVSAVMADLANDLNDDTFFFDSCELLEPTKASMLLYKQNPKGNKPPRKALINCWNPITYEYWSYEYDLDAFAVATKQKKKVSDKTKKKLAAKASITKKAIQGAHPHLTFTESSRAIGAILGSGPSDGNAAFYASMYTRGLTNTEILTKISFDISLDGSGSFDAPGYKARTVSLTPYYDDAGPNSYSCSYYGQPIDEVAIYIDLNKEPPAAVVVDNAEKGLSHSITKDTFCHNLAKASEEPNYCCFNRGSRDTLNRLKSSCTPSYTIDGYKVTWENWSFRYAPHPRHGLILYDVTYNDRHRSCSESNKRFCRGTQELVIEERQILYRASSEAVITKEVEYSPMRLFSSLIKGLDVPHYADLLSFPFTDETGEVHNIASAIGIYEEDAGILWRHADYALGKTFGRRGRRLVITHTTTVGSLDFAHYWLFNQDGSIQVDVKLTGQMGPSQSISQFFNYQLDFDIDGTQNKVFSVDTPTGKQEVSCGLSDHNLEANRYWLIENSDPGKKTCLGNQPAFALIPVSKNASLVVTPYSDVTAKEDDIVVWYSMGFTHLPHPEKNPIMPVETLSFSLKPYAFFNENPAMDVDENRFVP